VLINKEYMLHLDMQVKDCIAEFWVNGIPVTRLDSEVHSFNSLIAHHFLLDGLNTFEVVINPGPTPSLARATNIIDNDEKHSAEPKAIIQLMKYTVGAFVGDNDAGQILMQLNWEYDQKVHGEMHFPIVTKSSYQLGKHLGTWVWQTCPPLNLANEREQIIAVLADIYKSFITGNSARVVGFLMPYIQDAERALPGYSAAEQINDITNDINDNVQLTENASVFDIDKLDFRVCGQGNIVQIVNKDWLPTISIPLGQEYDDDKYALEMFIGKVKGYWRAVL